MIIKPKGKYMSVLDLLRNDLRRKTLNQLDIDSLFIAVNLEKIAERENVEVFEKALIDGFCKKDEESIEFLIKLVRGKLCKL